jgi:hypothetical protein
MPANRPIEIPSRLTAGTVHFAEPFTGAYSKEVERTFVPPRHLLFSALVFFVLSVLVLINAGCASVRTNDTDPAERGWSTKHKIAAGGLILAHALDFAQTHAGISSGYSESNPVMGSKPSDGRIAVAKLASLGAVLWLSHHFPEHRTKILAVALVIEGACIASNAHTVGVKMTF